MLHSSVETRMKPRGLQRALRLLLPVEYSVELRQEIGELLHPDVSSE